MRATNRPKKNSSATAVTPKSNAYAAAFGQFSPAALAHQQKLPCREAEFDNLLATIVDAMRQNQGLCIYLSGVPGTGKTATVKAVVCMLQAAAANQEIDAFTFVEVNAMAIADPSHAYALVAEAVARDSEADAAASSTAKKPRGRPRSNPAADSSKRRRPLAALQAHFQRGSSRYTIVLLDELDYLVTRSQAVVYNFFEWPNVRNSRLIVVGVANTMDLPERMLAHKVSSRLGMTRINFVPYTHQQLVRIVEFYLGAHADVFSAHAVELCARKVSAISGDVRRAMEIVKKALLLAAAASSRHESGNNTASTTPIGISLVQQAISETFSASTQPFVAALSLHQKIFLAGVAVQAHRTGLSDVAVCDVVAYHSQICRSYGVAAPSTDCFDSVLASLAEMRVVYSDFKVQTPSCARVSLGIGADDLRNALKTHDITKNLLSFE